MAKTVKKEQTTNESIVLDNKDFAILKLLQQNAKATVKDIAKQIHLS
ncbi:MAG: AsnC family protein, partial [Chitinophagaceae bacterium]|nr:AsnC family protein [Chitinophagaceae bacterium]